jgi:hypothetical protein
MMASERAPRAPAPRVLAMSAALVLALSCGSRVEERSMGEPIAMGPFVYSVEGTNEAFWQQDTKTILVELQLDQESSAPFRTPFGEFLVPHLAIVDGAGNSFEADAVSPVSGNALSSSEWEVRFILRPTTDGVRDRDHIGDSPSDFRLLIKNPEPRGDQARRVSIRLR